MISLLLILLPLLTGLAAFFIKDEKLVRTWAVLTSLVTLTIAILSLCCMNDTKSLNYHCEWLPSLGASFSLKMDGVAQLLCLLNTIAYPLVFIAGWDKTYKNAKNFFALMLLAQAGIMGVFLAADALLFYFFWELALIPMYFLCSQWGGEKRVAVTFKFFIYTFIGSLLMLISILYLYGQTPDHSFSIESFYNLKLTSKQQSIPFWLMFVAFAVKMPIFPVHTWQPDTYEQAPTSTTMILSGVMVKMGVFGLIRWLFPILSTASFVWGDVITLIAIIGMIYASLIALRQDDLKRLVAYSSIAHIGLLCAGMFTQNASGMQGVMIQMFSHGINIIVFLDSCEAILFLLPKMEMLLVAGNANRCINNSASCFVMFFPRLDIFSFLAPFFFSLTSFPPPPNFIFRSLNRMVKLFAPIVEKLSENF